MDHAGLRGLVGGGSDLGGGSGDVVTGQALDEALETGADDLVMLGATGMSATLTGRPKVERGNLPPFAGRKDL
jgi:hypothetical protein